MWIIKSVHHPGEHLSQEVRTCDYQGGAVGDAALLISTKADLKFSFVLYQESQRLRLFFETIAAEHGSALRWIKRDRRFSSTGRTFDPDRNFLTLAVCRGNSGLYSLILCSLARLAAFWRICQPFLVEERTLTGRPDKLRLAVGAKDRNIRQFSGYRTSVVLRNVRIRRHQ